MSQAADLRDALVTHLEENRTIRDPRIAGAMRQVPREAFVPQATLEDAYADRALILKERDGALLSSISQPSMIAHMLELLGPERGTRVLEIGTGSGYNAALLAELAGPHGAVDTVELEPDLAATARATLQRSGYERVRVLSDDAFDPADAAYERIIVTARASDIDPRWWRALRDGGRIVVPLDIGYGGERAIAFERDGERLVSSGSCACAFVALRGERTDGGGIFFRSQFQRLRAAPAAHLPLHVVAVERAHARPSLLEEHDAVVARPHTLFAIRR